MFIKRADELEPEIVHNSGAVHWLLPEGTMREETKGAFLDFCSDFTVEAGAQLEPHFHDTFEYYFILEGEAVMQIEEEAHIVSPGDLIQIPRNARHTIWPTAENKVRAFCFAVSFQEPGQRYTPCELPRVEPTPR